MTTFSNLQLHKITKTLEKYIHNFKVIVLFTHNVTSFFGKVTLKPDKLMLPNGV